MRTILAALLTLAPLAGCGISDESARNQFRQGSVQACLDASRNSPAPAGFNWQRFCSCATERVMAGKSARELAQMQPGTPEQRQIAEQCAAEQQPAGGRVGPNQTAAPPAPDAPKPH